MNHHPSSPHGLEPLLNIDELADYLGVPVSTIYDWRTNGCLLYTSDAADVYSV